MAFAQLIPGLPNDLAVQCLLRLPSEELLRVQKVSSLWRIAITSDGFYVERRLKSPYPSICAIRRIHSRYQILDTEVVNLASPHRILFSCDLAAGQVLFPPRTVFATVGASVFAFAPGRHAQKFSLITRRWIPLGRNMPPECTLLATTVGEYVVVVVAGNGSSGDEGSGDSHHIRHAMGGRHMDPSDGVLQHTICEVFDSHEHTWVPTEGLPEDFCGTHSFTFQGIAYVRGTVSGEGSPPVFSVYALDLSKRRWKEDVHMCDRMHSVGLGSKIIMKPDALLRASLRPDDTVAFQHQKAGTPDWLDVTRWSAKRPGDFFIFQQGDEVFLGVAAAGERWDIKRFFHYHGLVMLSIPCEELLMAEPIVA